ncbi:hypothetical protein HF086_003734 [Spodoptera exigua]|uniref:Carboxypeptidase activation peptide domain-containing protein n=1 Tax=Spodoptera exigua TaxID=7107 RepID=A0A922M790_SPOEX|nr:hypothetical protein HF086_003734 [Spodoptera exigua]
MTCYGLYKVSVKTTDQVELVNYLSKALDLDVWSHAIPGHDGQVLVPKDKKPLFQNELKAAGVEFQIESDNIKEFEETFYRIFAPLSDLLLTMSDCCPHKIRQYYDSD